MKNKALMKQFREDLDFLKNIIVKNDPVGLIDGGAPRDEYDRYIISILSFIESKKNKIDLGEYIYQVFEKAFGDMVDKKVCFKVAKLFLDRNKHYKTLPKIDKSKLPKTARRWSFSVIFCYPVFVIANKLWLFLYVYIVLNLFNFSLFLFKLDTYIINLISVFTFAIFMFFTFYLVFYGRALAWQKLGYKETPENIEKFKLRQRIIFYVSILIIGLLILYFVYSLNLAHNQIISQ